ncbi:hypothetical protein CPB86DRAFT_356630 [Serendipita vermifera]|nr:hypothetical protein CPB86DRAFT_356630 [Serendipita vermifera]
MLCLVRACDRADSRIYRGGKGREAKEESWLIPSLWRLRENVWSSSREDFDYDQYLDALHYFTRLYLFLFAPLCSSSPVSLAYLFLHPV